MNRRVIRKPTSERGAAMVELIIAMPLLVIMIFGVIGFGIAYNRAQGLNHAAREGARLGSLRNTTSGEIDARVADALTGVTYESAPTVSVTPAIGQPCLNREGQTVTVEVSANYTLSIPFIPDIPLPLEGRGTFRCEGG